MILKLELNYVKVKMSCNCKTIKKIQSISPNANNVNSEKNGFVKLFHNVLSPVSNLAVKLGIMLLILVAIPFVFIVLAFNVFYQGKTTVQLPSKGVKALINYDKNHS